MRYRRLVLNLCAAAAVMALISGCEATDPFTGRMAGAGQIQFELDNFLQSTGSQIDKLNVDLANKKRLVAALDDQLKNQETQANTFIGGIENMLGQAPATTDGGLAAGLGLTGVFLQQNNRRKDRKIGDAQDDLEKRNKKDKEAASKVAKPVKASFTRKPGAGPGKAAGQQKGGAADPANVAELPAAAAIPGI